MDLQILCNIANQEKEIMSEYKHVTSGKDWLTGEHYVQDSSGNKGTGWTKEDAGQAYQAASSSSSSSDSSGK
jgi:hypothetical protein